MDLQGGETFGGPAGIRCIIGSRNGSEILGFRPYQVQKRYPSLNTSIKQEAIRDVEMSEVCWLSKRDPVVSITITGTALKFGGSPQGFESSDRCLGASTNNVKALSVHIYYVKRPQDSFTDLERSVFSLG